MFEPETPSR